MPENGIQSHIATLTELRGNPVIVYASVINDDGVRIAYECLRRMGHVSQLDVVLSTGGGTITAARRLALLLREYASRIAILVPYRARSAGTLLCLSANELTLGPMAELGPLDPQVGTAGAMPPDAPPAISAQDIQAFPAMAKDWFGVERAEDRLQVLALVAQRIFPTSLSAFYRFDRLARQVADELLAYQLPDAGADVRQGIVQQLVAGYAAHDYAITRAEARCMGLQVRVPPDREEQCLWDLEQALRLQFAAKPGEVERSVTALIASASVIAREVYQLADGSPGAPGTPSSAGNRLRSSWEFEECAL
ncbi:peptidase [Dictyobacter sp. S3.2.2.5]|uniref:Peptidase n=1 Tax=Dictyobacter halimunensis TaxID=3026934 RepID=A0ABQ6FK33_9CHLR|nr:peptidase [Dictyobacter sp. S3.2.2.5]